jgi:hypothetical protein
MKNPSQDSRSPGQVLNLGPPEYEYADHLITAFSTLCNENCLKYANVSIKGIT